MRFGVWFRVSAVASVAVLALLAAVRSPSLDAAPAEAAAGTLHLTLDPGIAADEGLDWIYRESGAAMIARQAELLGACYTPDALYLGAENPAGSPIVRGRKAITDGFQTWFRYLEEKGGRVVESTARVIAREEVGDFAYDVGYWRITTVMPGEEPKAAVWKYSNVFRRGAGGQWLVHIDTNMPAPVEEFAG